MITLTICVVLEFLAIVLCVARIATMGAELLEINARLAAHVEALGAELLEINARLEAHVEALKRLRLGRGAEVSKSDVEAATRDHLRADNLYHELTSAAERELRRQQADELTRDIRDNVKKVRT